MKTSSYWLKILLCLLVLIPVFSAPPFVATTVYENDSTKLATDSPKAAFLLAQFAKANAEIQMRTERQDNWFYLKFIIVGALFFAFLTHTSFLKTSDRVTIESIEQLTESPATPSILAISCVLSLIIDVHLRTESLIIGQLGAWIANYLEPLFLPTHEDPTVGGFLGWESLLQAHGGFHADPFYQFTQSGHYHALTVLLYIAFVGALDAHLRSAKGRLPPNVRGLLLACFLVVHVSAIAFAWAAHTLPAAFRFEILNLESLSLKSPAAGGLYAAMASLLLVINWRTLARLRQPARESSGDESISDRP